MDAKERNDIAEMNREIEIDRKYRELVEAQELKAVREQSIKENPSAAPAKRPPSKLKRKASVFATAAMTTIVTVAAVISLTISVKLISFIADYTSLQFVIDIESPDDSPLTAQLCIGGDTLREMEILPSKGISLSFDDLEMGIEYELKILTDKGKEVFSKTFATRSPLNFFEKEGEPDRLYFEIDTAAFATYQQFHAILESESGLDFMAISQTDKGEQYIDKSVLFAGFYSFKLQGYSDDGSGELFTLFVFDMKFDGRKPPVFEFDFTSEGIRYRMIEGELDLYELSYAAIEGNGMYEQYDLSSGADQFQLIPAQQLVAGSYEFFVVAQREMNGSSVSVIIYRKTIYWEG